MKHTTWQCDLCGSEVPEKDIADLTIHYDGDTGSQVAKLHSCPTCVTRMKEGKPLLAPVFPAVAPWWQDYLWRDYPTVPPKWEIIYG